jgi:hypothetical protein
LSQIQPEGPVAIVLDRAGHPQAIFRLGPVEFIGTHARHPPYGYSAGMNDVKLAIQ